METKEQKIERKIEEIEDFTETTIDYLKWGKYNIVFSRLEDLKDKVLELKELENDTRN